MADNTHKFGSLEKIKSIYLLNDLFAFLSENIQLELITHNNQLKKDLKVSTENYKKQCQKELIFGKEGKVKEYYKGTNILLY